MRSDNIAMLARLIVLVAVLEAPLGAATPEFRQGEKATVLIFTTTDCPISNAMLPEVSRLEREFASQGVSFTLVHVDPDTTAAKAREHAKSYGIRMPFLLDPEHQLVKRYQATPYDPKESKTTAVK